jgi:branched-chain amino acid transport system II carrier protein
MENRKKYQDIIVVGFALFAIFFGAGNLIFPPHIGVMAGKRWYEVMFGFLMTDPLLPIVGVIVTASVGGKADDLGKRVSPSFSKLLGAISILIIGPFFSVPRTAATTHEIAVSQIFPGVPLVVTSVVFFGLTLFLVLNPGKVIDKIGKYLTPALLIVLFIIIVKCIVQPIGELQETPEKHLFMLGFTEGYQTMDALGSALMSGIVLSDLINRGYKDGKEQFNVMIGVGIVTFILLALVYGGLTYVGATAGQYYTADTPRVELLIGIVEHMFGNVGKICAGLVVSLACLTTSVGLTATCGNFFENISNGKLKYKYIVIASVALSFIISLAGVESIINYAVPVLTTIYPVVIALVILTAFNKFIKHNMTYIGAVLGAFIIGLVQSLNASLHILQGLVDSINKLPFATIGLSWVSVSVVFSVVFTLIAVFTAPKNQGA